MKLWALVATIILSTATLTGCKKDNSNDNNPSNNPWGAETLTFNLNNSSDAFVMKKVNGGDYSMKYMYDNQETTVTGTLSDFYISPVEVTNKIWTAVMGHALLIVQNSTRYLQHKVIYAGNHLR